MRYTAPHQRDQPTNFRGMMLMLIIAAVAALVILGMLLNNVFSRH
jgi:hypothetical protein